MNDGDRFMGEIRRAIEVTQAHDKPWCGPDPLLFSDDMCINGERYSYCGDQNCGGACEPIGACRCCCHSVAVTPPE